MGVYIKGFPLPNNCGACPLRLAWCRERIYLVTRPERCPLVPVPPHGRLGDLDRLESGLRLMAKYQNGERQQGILGCCETIRLAETIISAEEGKRCMTI